MSDPEIDPLAKPPIVDGDVVLDAETYLDVDGDSFFPWESEAVFHAYTEMDIAGIRAGVTNVALSGSSHMHVDAAHTPPPPDASHFSHRARHAAIAAGTPQRQYDAAVARAVQSVAVRRRLPRTQVQFYAQRLAPRR